jgi:hypothetical protein
MAQWKIKNFVQVQPECSGYMKINYKISSTTRDQAFPAAAFRIWNGLRSDVMAAVSLSLFNRQLKTAVSCESFPPVQSHYIVTPVCCVLTLIWQCQLCHLKTR